LLHLSFKTESYVASYEILTEFTLMIIFFWFMTPYHWVIRTLFPK